MPTAYIDLFVEVCEQSGAKPLLIELAQCNYRQQPMFSKIVYVTDLKAVFAEASYFSALLKVNGFHPKE